MQRQDGVRVRVLVVDDDAGIRDVLRAFLEEEGYDVSVASDGEEALRAALGATEPLVVLLDLLLPALSGEDMLAATLEYQESGHASAPIAFIIITATWQQLLTPRLLAVTKRYHIPVEHKPFDVERLLATVANSAGTLSDQATG